MLTATGERDHGKAGRANPSHARDGIGSAWRCSSDLGFPPWNGFVSEWLTFQTILLSPELPQWGFKLFVPATGALLALSVALAAACFVRFYGTAFLSRARSQAAAEASETDAVSCGVMLALAALCLLIGILPGYVIDWMAPVIQGLVGGHMPQQSSVAWLSLVPISKTRSSYNGLLVFLFIAASASFAVYAIHRLATKATRRAPIWDCGFPSLDPSMQYTASSFSSPSAACSGRSYSAPANMLRCHHLAAMTPAHFRVQLDDIWDTLYAADS